jgi:ZIP family zinc transporter
LVSGLVEPVGGLAGAALVSIATPLLPWALGFAAGAMIYVVLSEIVPDVQARLGGGHRASSALMAGLVTMMFLDTTLG